MSLINVGNLTSSEKNVIECKWEIHVKYLIGKRRGEGLKSPLFSTVGSNFEKIEWALEFYPQGQVNAKENYTSIFLESLNPNEIKASVTFSILNQNKSEIVGFQTEKHLFKKNDLFGYHNFVEESFIHDEKNKIINDNKLIIECKITTEEHSLTNVVNKENSLWLKVSNDFKKMMTNKEFSDVTIAVHGKYFYLHRCILANRSPVFKSMFTHDKKTATVEVIGIKYEVMYQFFQFLYTGTVDRIEDIAWELFYTAKKFSVKELKTLCLEKMCNCINEFNAVEFLSIAEVNNSKKLLSKAIEFIATHLKDFIDKPEFQSYRVSHPEMFNEIVKQNLQMQQCTQ